MNGIEGLIKINSSRLIKWRLIWVYMRKSCLWWKLQNFLICWFLLEFLFILKRHSSHCFDNKCALLPLKFLIPPTTPTLPRWAWPEKLGCAFITFIISTVNSHYEKFLSTRNDANSAEFTGNTQSTLYLLNRSKNQTSTILFSAHTRNGFPWKQQQQQQNVTHSITRISY